MFERFCEVYRLPRAVHLDHEVMRILQNLGVADELADELLPLYDYHWYGADGEALMTLAGTERPVSGWDPDYLFYQPALENALEERARSFENVSVNRGWEAERIEPAPGHVQIQLRAVDEPHPGTIVPTQEEQIVHARWVIGADGASSFVRESVGISRRDLGFQERWLVVDVEPHDMTALELPRACQWCDPKRPTTHVQSGQRHRRWEFMLLPGEHRSDFDEARAWELLGPVVRPAGRTARAPHGLRVPLDAR